MAPKEYDLVCLGGGVTAGYWAEAYVDLLASDPLLKKRTTPLSIAIISSYPEGVYPYERPACSKELLDPAATLARDLTVKNSTFPFTSSQSSKEARGAKWYKAHNIHMIWGCQCTAIDADERLLSLSVWLEDSGKHMTAAKPKAVKYGKLLIATGAAPLKLKPTLTSPDITPSTGCYCIEHPDIRLLKLDAATVESCGHGSAHYLHDIGDTHKLVKALSVPTASEEDNTVVIAGSGYLALEAVSAILKWYPGLNIVMLVKGSHIMAGLLNQELADVYEEELESRGVKLIWHAEAQRLWQPSEIGKLNTPDGIEAFEKDGRYRNCRGVVASVSGNATYIQARITVVCAGCKPNSKLLQGVCTMMGNGAIIVDSALLTSKQHIYAAGGMPKYSIILNVLLVSVCDANRHAHAVLVFTQLYHKLCCVVKIAHTALLTLTLYAAV
eukprot:10088-Heterococcus_DN1.PRE.3